MSSDDDAAAAEVRSDQNMGIQSCGEGLMVFHGVEP